MIARVTDHCNLGSTYKCTFVNETVEQDESNECSELFTIFSCICGNIERQKVNC